MNAQQRREPPGLIVEKSVRLMRTRLKRRSVPVGLKLARLLSALQIKSPTICAEPIFASLRRNVCLRTVC